MVAVYVILAILTAAALIAVGRRIFRTAHSIEDYHKTMDLLGEIRERGHRPDVGVPQARSPIEQPSKPASMVSSNEDSLRVSPVAPVRSLCDDGERTHEPHLVFVDDALSADDLGQSRAQLISPLVTRQREGRHLSSRRHYWLVPAGAIVALAGIILGLVVTNTGPTHPKHVAAPKASGRNQSHRLSPPTTSATTTTAVSASAARPVISSLTPDVAAAGETLTITGTGFASADGEIVATFGSQLAPTRCPSEQTCLVTVPPESKASVPVRVRTESGRSNAVQFQYG